MELCKICTIEIPYGQYCENCKKCIHCTHDVSVNIIDELLRKFTGEITEFKTYHPYCHNQKLENDFKSKPVIITQEHLDMLNAANLMFRPNLDLSIETNQKEAEIQANKFVHQMTLEEKYITLRRMETIAAIWSIALSKDKNRIQVQLSEKERIKFKDLQNAGDKLEYEKKKEKKRNAMTNMSPKEKQKEKAIQALTKLGMSREAAIQTLGLQLPVEWKRKCD